jgi:cell division protein FtsW
VSVTAEPGRQVLGRPAGTAQQGRVAGGRRGAVATSVATMREHLARPLTPYYLLLGATSLLLAIGLVMVLSASSVDGFEHHGNSYYWAIKQLMWVLVALPCAWIATRLPLRVLRFAAWPVLLVSVVLLALTQTSLGVEVNGNKNWLGLGPLQIQPSEVAKFAMVLWCADVYARKDALLDSWRHLAIPVLPVAGVITGLVLVGGDLGTALVMFAITLGMLWVVGVPTRFFVGAVSLVSVAALYLAASSPERLNRITSFSNPFNDFQNSGWQAGHGILGMASGGLFGKGIGASQQKWGNLPEAHTDFIFAVLGEELGLVGTLLVLGLFLVIAYAGLRVAMRAQNLFVRYATAGIVIWLTAHMIINVGMVLALLPVIGIPLPLVSYGGSSLVPELVALGLVIGFARSDPDAAGELKRRRHERRGARTGRRAVNAGAVPRRWS